MPTHGPHPIERQTWQNVIARCTYPRDKKYAYYGGRGIKVCQRWLDSFKAFFEDMGPRPSDEYCIDRIDPNGNYEPGNVRWALRADKNKNRRSTIFVEHDGRTLHMSAWSRETGIPLPTLIQRWHRGRRGPELFSRVALKRGRRRAA